MSTETENEFRIEYNLNTEENRVKYFYDQKTAPLVLVSWINGQAIRPDYVFEAQADEAVYVKGTLSSDWIKGNTKNDDLEGDGGDDSLSGGGGADRLYGGFGNDILYGDSGDDQLHGQSGNDGLSGGIGDDILTGGAGDDTLLGGAGRDFIYGGQGEDMLIGGAGDDVIHGSAGKDNFYGGFGLNYLNGGSESDTFYTGQGVDIIDGGTGDDIFVIEGDTFLYETNADETKNEDYTKGGHYFVVTDFEAGDRLINKTVSDSGDAERLVYETGSDHSSWTYSLDSERNKQVSPTNDPNINDTLVYYQDITNDDGQKLVAILEDYTYSPFNFIYGTEESDVLRGGKGDDKIYGLQGNDYLYGNGGNDIIIGGPGDDKITTFANAKIYGGTGVNEIDVRRGGDGDIVIYTGEGYDYIDYLGPNDKLVVLDVEDTIFVVENSENLDNTSVNFSHVDRSLVTLEYKYTHKENVFVRFEDRNNPGISDTVVRYNGKIIGVFEDYRLELEDVPEFVDITVIDGTEGDDILYGDNEIGNIINGYGGKDFIYGYTGDDYLDGGEGDDTLHGHIGDDTLFGGSGNDWLIGEEGFDTIYSGSGDDIIFGGKDADIIYGDNGNDKLYGGLGNDTLYGGIGRDKLRGGEGNDVIYGEAGDDVLVGNSGNDTLYGGAGEDLIFGGTGDDIIFGGSGRDDIYGGKGDNEINGGDGDDIIYIDFGNDTILTGDGKDLITINNNGGYFTINDFSEDDLIYTHMSGKITVSYNSDGTGTDILYDDNKIGYLADYIGPVQILIDANIHDLQLDGRIRELYTAPEEAPLQLVSNFEDDTVITVEASGGRFNPLTSKLHGTHLNITIEDYDDDGTQDTVFNFNTTSDPDLNNPQMVLLDYDDPLSATNFEFI